MGISGMPAQFRGTSPSLKENIDRLRSVSGYIGMSYSGPVFRTPLDKDRGFATGQIDLEVTITVEKGQPRPPFQQTVLGMDKATRGIQYLHSGLYILPGNSINDSTN
jgi:hypothetical protein